MRAGIVAFALALAPAGAQAGFGEGAFGLSEEEAAQLALRRGGKAAPAAELAAPASGLGAPAQGLGAPAQGLGAPARPAPVSPTAPPTASKRQLSPDGRFLWEEGKPYVLVQDQPGHEAYRIRLPRLPEGAQRRLLFAEQGDLFLVLDIEDIEFGLHLGPKEKQQKAKALLLRSTLHLVEATGSVRWTRALPDKTAVWDAEAGRSWRIAFNGTTAVLLQDVDPYAKARPVLLVLDAKGRALLRLDYAAWTRVDEFALAETGRILAVRGFGLIPDEADWGEAFGHYQLRRNGAPPSAEPPEPASVSIHRLGSPGEGRHLKGIDEKGWACCARDSGALVAFGPGGRRQNRAP